MSIDIKKARKFLLDREENEKEQNRALYDELIEKLFDLDQVWDSYGIELVYLYGSLSDGSFHMNSDVDLAYHPEIKFESLAKLMLELRNNFKREVDLRCLDKLEFAENIRSNGKKIYVKKN